MRESIRFLTDENFDRWIIRGLRQKQPGIDILTAVEAGILHQPDPLVLAYAAEHNRILLSQDTKTMPGHFRDFLDSERESPGVFLVPQSLAIGQAIDAILEIWGASSPEEWRNQCTRLPL